VRSWQTTLLAKGRAIPLRIVLKLQMAFNWENGESSSTLTTAAAATTTTAIAAIAAIAAVVAAAAAALKK